MMMIPPASRTKYRFPETNFDNEVLSMPHFSTGRWRQYKLAASGSNAMVSLLSGIPAFRQEVRDEVKDNINNINT